MKRQSAFLTLLGIGALGFIGCQETVEDEASDVVEARSDVQEEKIEGLSEIEGEAAEANREVTDEQEELVEEKKELKEVLNEGADVPAESTANVEGDPDAIEEVEPQN